jgi:hypothetical protein
LVFGDGFQHGALMVGGGQFRVPGEVEITDDEVSYEPIFNVKFKRKDGSTSTQREES